MNMDKHILSTKTEDIYEEEEEEEELWQEQR